jgi:hypothetical protein
MSFVLFGDAGLDWGCNTLAECTASVFGVSVWQAPQEGVKVLYCTVLSSAAAALSPREPQSEHFRFLFPSLCGLSRFKTLYSVLNTCHFLKSSKSLHVSA